MISRSVLLRELLHAVVCGCMFVVYAHVVPCENGRRNKVAELVNVHLKAFVSHSYTLSLALLGNQATDKALVKPVLL